MPKISPSNEKQDLLNNQTTNDSSDIVLPKKKVFFGGCFSMRIVIILLIVSLLFLCSLFIWLASFIGSRTAVNELTTNLINQVGRKILVFLESQIAPSSGLAKSIASDFKLGIIDRQPPLSYLFEKNNIYRPSSVGVFYPTEMYGYFNLTFFTKGYPEETFTVYIKHRDSVGIEQWNASVSTGSLLDIVVNQTTPIT
ncbi:predicted protein [Naegleria gruberi]|uniref:Predicted protein n=1 Tax=Naegleria gruberi TaxID=5762 RepID=D2VCU5_NAEGR|nr:uncharacterized protein NAEGRDRAFT_66695 [Naegleria gruberi]EFC45366.1 predicted protein [Naegleria gruberi]|eukprot:XP_002678110.1 predicted protein [Naegleria gruberi strain NEG-M]